MNKRIKKKKGENIRMSGKAERKGWMKSWMKRWMEKGVYGWKKGWRFKDAFTNESEEVNKEWMYERVNEWNDKRKKGLF